MRRPPSHTPRACLLVITALLAWLDPGLAGATDERRVELLFASTRVPTGDSDAEKFLGPERGPLRYGACEVGYETSPRAGRWSGYRDLLVPGDSREVVAARELGEQDFVDRITGTGAKARVVLVVHGYAYSFGRACRRVSDLQVVLGEDARVVLFSWPSAGNVLVYEEDRESLAASLDDLARTIERLAAQLDPPRLAIAAHSMGAWGVLEALPLLRDDVRDTIAGDLVLIAPDYPAERFRARFEETVRPRFERVTLYTSASDLLLKLSSTVNDGLRLGQGGTDAVLLPGLETIDLSTLPRHHPGAHEYHYYNPHVVADLAELLRTGTGASGRRATLPRDSEHGGYWVLRASAEAAD